MNFEQTSHATSCRELTLDELTEVSGGWWINIKVGAGGVSVTGGLGDGVGNGNVGMRNHQGPAKK